MLVLFFPSRCRDVGADARSFAPLVSCGRAPGALITTGETSLLSRKSVQRYSSVVCVCLCVCVCVCVCARSYARKASVPTHLRHLAEGEARVYGDCDFEVLFAPINAVEVADSVKGLVARVSLYMHDAYTSRGLLVQLSDEELNMYRGWNCEKPPEPWECERNSAVFEIQGKALSHTSRFTEDHPGRWMCCWHFAPRFVPCTGNYNHVTYLACEGICQEVRLPS